MVGLIVYDHYTKYERSIYHLDHYKRHETRVVLSPAGAWLVRACATTKQVGIWIGATELGIGY